MKKVLFLFLIFFLGQRCISQDDFNKEYWLIRANIEKPYETLLRHTIVSPKQSEYKIDSFFIDHVIRKYSGPGNLKYFISNRFFLERFNYDFLLHDKSALQIAIDTNKFRIEAKKISKSLSSLGKIQYDSTVFNTVHSTDGYTYILSINSKEIFGLTWDTPTVSVLDSLTISINDKRFIIPDSIFSDLYFPNFCEISPNKRPIEAFLSPNKKYIYLYVTGGQMNVNFFCKIIFDIEGRKVVGRMIADNNELSWYRTFNKNFIGF